jgi:hypothetical protein
LTSQNNYDIIKMFTNKSNQMEKEFIVWGVAPNTTEEQVLYTKAQTLADAHAIASYLITDKGCTDTRVQVIDFTKQPDFQNIFN